MIFGEKKMSDSQTFTNYTVPKRKKGGEDNALLKNGVNKTVQNGGVRVGIKRFNSNNSKPLPKNGDQ